MLSAEREAPPGNYIGTYHGFEMLKIPVGFLCRKEDDYTERLVVQCGADLVDNPCFTAIDEYIEEKGLF